MSALANLLFAVMFLLEPEEKIDVSAARAVSEDANRVEIRGEAKPGAPAKEKRENARITSVSSDFDRKAGVALFEGRAMLRYSDDYVLCADRIWAFMVGSNRLGRVVATGHVSITNETRLGTCAMAVYRRRRSEIEMFGDGTNQVARLVENGDDASAIEGSRIKFWIDSEQVEVDRSQITSQQDGDRKKVL